MKRLSAYKDLVIDWEMTPEDAVALYLEWGNNGYRGGYQNAVRGKGDTSYYFIVDTWDKELKVRFVRRNSDGVDYLSELILPAELASNFLDEVGHHKGVYGVNTEIKKWLEKQIYE